MESLIITSDRLVKYTNTKFLRYLYHEIAWDNRLIGIVGAKGTGKSTLLLQYIKLSFSNKSKAIYVSLDNIWFTKHSLSELAEDFYIHGGTHLFLDEVHRYSTWAVEIKNIYDSYPELHIVFTGSSMLEIFKTTVDFSRRALVYELKGLSFREFLKYENALDLPVLNFNDILKTHRDMASDIVSKIKILPQFNKYLEYGYYPYYKENITTYPIRMAQSMDKNSNIIHALTFKNQHLGHLRETFFSNQLRTKHTVNTAQNLAIKFRFGCLECYIEIITNYYDCWNICSIGLFWLGSRIYQHAGGRRYGYFHDPVHDAGTVPHHRQRYKPHRHRLAKSGCRHQFQTQQNA